MKIKDEVLDLGSFDIKDGGKCWHFLTSHKWWSTFLNTFAKFVSS
jgi:hypothetical protein